MIAPACRGQVSDRFKQRESPGRPAGLLGQRQIAVRRPVFSVADSAV